MSKLPAIALIEFRSIAAGTFATDAMIKKAPVQLLQAGTVQPGRYLVLVGGGTAEVEESYREGIRAGTPEVLDDVFLPDVHPVVVEAVEGKRDYGKYDSLVVLETSTSAAILRATDAAVKGALVGLGEMRLANGLGGKGVALLTGELSDVQAAAEIADNVLAGREVKFCRSIVSRAHEEFAARLAESSRFYPVKGPHTGV